MPIVRLLFCFIIISCCRDGLGLSSYDDYERDENSFERPYTYENKLELQTQFYPVSDTQFSHYNVEVNVNQENESNNNNSASTVSDDDNIADNELEEPIFETNTHSFNVNVPNLGAVTITLQKNDDVKQDLDDLDKLKVVADRYYDKLLHSNKLKEAGLDDIDYPTRGRSKGETSKSSSNKFKNKFNNEHTDNAGPHKRPRIKNFIGSNLFDAGRKRCFSAEDVTLLAVRRDFEHLIPKDLPRCLLRDNMVNLLMQYFYCGHYMIKRQDETPAKRLLEKAYYDMLGGYLHHYVVPVTKFSYYAGLVDVKTAENVLALYSQCKEFLNTNGNGWRTQIRDPMTELRETHVERLSQSEVANPAISCTELDLSSVNNDAEDEQMIVSLPKLDYEDNNGLLGNIWLPFKRKKTYDLRNPKSAAVVLRFFKTVSGCYDYQDMCQDTYNSRLKDWITENVLIHLPDEQFYPGLGGVLRIYETLKHSNSNPSCSNENSGGASGQQDNMCDNSEVSETEEDGDAGDAGDSDKLDDDSLQNTDSERYARRYPVVTGLKLTGKNQCNKKTTTCKPDIVPTPSKMNKWDKKKALKYTLYGLASVLSLGLLVVFGILSNWCVRSLYARYKQDHKHKHKKESCWSRICGKKEKKHKDKDKDKDKHKHKDKGKHTEKTKTKPQYKPIPQPDITTSSSALFCQPFRCVPVPKSEHCRRKNKSTDTDTSVLIYPEPPKHKPKKCPKCPKYPKCPKSKSRAASKSPSQPKTKPQPEPQPTPTPKPKKKKKKSICKKKCRSSSKSTPSTSSAPSSSAPSPSPPKPKKKSICKKKCRSSSASSKSTPSTSSAPSSSAPSPSPSPSPSPCTPPSTSHKKEKKHKKSPCHRRKDKHAKHQEEHHVPEEQPSTSKKAPQQFSFFRCPAGAEQYPWPVAADPGRDAVASNLTERSDEQQPPRDGGKASSSWETIFSI